MVTLILAINCKKNVLSLIHLEIQNLKIVKYFAKLKLLGCAVCLRLLQKENFSIAIDKRDYHIPMIYLGKSKEVTAVLNFN